MSEHNKSHSRGPSIIGGMFGLEIEIRGDSASAVAQPQILAGPHLRLITARSALTLLARTLRPANVWLPSYLCGVVLDAFADSGSRIHFYSVCGNLQILDHGWVANVQAGDMVIFIDYFGFNMWDLCGKQAKERGAWLVEDACQAMLNPRFGEYADYVIASPRKFVGVPDGGILFAQNGAALPSKDLPAPPAEWWLNALKASQLRAEFDRHGGDRQWFELFRATDPNGPTEPSRMSELSSLLLDHAIDYAVIAESRRRNFSEFAAALPEFALFPELSGDVVPLGFPVRVLNRDHVRVGLFDCEIYPPVHWPIQNIVPDEFQGSHRLAQQIMTLPCDQRFTFEDIRRIAQTFRSCQPVPDNPMQTTVPKTDP